MKKIQLNAAKLQLNKEKISTLTNNQMNVIRGGDDGGDDDAPQEFTYSFSLGARCQRSNKLLATQDGPNNAYECGRAEARQQEITVKYD